MKTIDQIKMSDVFELPVAPWAFSLSMQGANGRSEAAANAINNHDRLAAENEALREEVDRLEALLSDQQKWMDHISSERDSFEQERDQLKSSLLQAKEPSS